MITPSFSLTATERVLPKLALDFTTAVLDPRVTFTRTTDATHPATYVNSSGLIVNATNNQARFDYSPTSVGVCKGLLIEESRSNALQYSDDITVSTWGKFGQVFGVPVASPVNGVNAQVFGDGATTNYHCVYQTYTPSVGSTYTMSVYVKYIDHQYVMLSANAGGSFFAAAVFDISNGTVASTNALGTGWTVSASVQSAYNGYLRLVMTYVHGTAGASAAAISFTNSSSSPGAGSSGLISYAGTSTTAAIIGAQLEVGAFPTSYIPTTGAALTRNADVATMTGTNFSSWFNATEGTFEAQYILKAINPASPGYNQGVLSALKTDYTYSITLEGYDQSYASGIFKVIDAGSNQAVLGSSVSANVVNKISGAYKVNSFAEAINGGSINTDVSGTVPSGLLSMNIGSDYFSNRQLNGWLQKINYYPQRLTNAEVQATSK